MQWLTLLCNSYTQRANNGCIGKVGFSLIAASGNNVCSPTPRICEQFIDQTSLANTCISLEDDDSSIIFGSMVCFEQCCPFLRSSHQRVCCYRLVPQGAMEGR